MIAAIGSPFTRACVGGRSLHVTVGGGGAAWFTCGSFPLGTRDGTVQAASRPKE
jgi:hypothetical protein